MEPVITHPHPIDTRRAIAAQPRAIGAAVLSVRADETGKTRIRDLRQSGSTKLIFPQARPAGAEVILVNTAGGITGDDRFDLAIDVQADAALTVTTQAAERAYRAQRGEVGHVNSRLSVKAGGVLHWMPQELILFERSALRRRLEITLEVDAQLLMVEPVVMGRAAMGETLHDVMFHDRIRITRDAMPLYIDGMDLQGDVTAHFARSAIASHAGAVASVVMVHPDVARMVPAVRAVLPQTAGASLLYDDFLVIRLLAPDSFELRRSLIPVLERLSNTILPKSWSL